MLALDFSVRSKISVNLLKLLKVIRMYTSEKIFNVLILQKRNKMLLGMRKRREAWLCLQYIGNIRKLQETTSVNCPLQQSEYSRYITDVYYFMMYDL